MSFCIKKTNPIKKITIKQRNKYHQNILSPNSEIGGVPNEMPKKIEALKKLITSQTSQLFFLCSTDEEKFYKYNKEKEKRKLFTNMNINKVDKNKDKIKLRKINIHKSINAKKIFPNIYIHNKNIQKLRDIKEKNIKVIKKKFNYNLRKNLSCENFYKNVRNKVGNNHFNRTKMNSMNQTNKQVDSDIINSNELEVLQTFLSNTSKDIDKINKNIKIFKKDKDELSYKLNSLYHEPKEQKIFSMLKQNKNVILKPLRKESTAIGAKIFLKKPTADLIIYGNYFAELPENIFFREYKNLLSSYPKIQTIFYKEAKFTDNHEKEKKLEKNSLLIRDLDVNNRYLFRQLIDK